MCVDTAHQVEAFCRVQRLDKGLKPAPVCRNSERVPCVDRRLDAHGLPDRRT